MVFGLLIAATGIGVTLILFQFAIALQQPFLSRKARAY